MISKKEFAQAMIKGNVELICIRSGYSKEYKARYNRYRIYINGNPLESWNCDWYKKIPYFTKRSECMVMTIWGTSQEFEALYNLACLARNAINSTKIPKNHGDFCKWFKDKINVKY